MRGGGFTSEIWLMWSSVSACQRPCGFSNSNAGRFCVPNTSLNENVFSAAKLFRKPWRGAVRGKHRALCLHACSKKRGKSRIGRGGTVRGKHMCLRLDARECGGGPKRKAKQIKNVEGWRHRHRRQHRRSRGRLTVMKTSRSYLSFAWLEAKMTCLAMLSSSRGSSLTCSPCNKRSQEAMHREAVRLFSIRRSEGERERDNKREREGGGVRRRVTGRSLIECSRRRNPVNTHARTKSMHVAP